MGVVQKEFLHARHGTELGRNGARHVHHVDSQSRHTGQIAQFGWEGACVNGWEGRR